MTQAARFPSVELRDLPAANGASDWERMPVLIGALSAYIEYFHGGSITLESFDGETLTIRLAGECLGCPLPPVTLHGWVEGTVRQFFPNLKHVQTL